MSGIPVNQLRKLSTLSTSDKETFNLFIFFKQRLLDTLDKDEDKQKKRLGEMTRKITVLRVNEKSLSRRYTAMQEVEAALRKENKKYRNDVVAMETAITERLGYLQRHKVFFQFFNFFYFPFFSDFFFLGYFLCQWTNECKNISFVPVVYHRAASKLSERVV